MEALRLEAEVVDKFSDPMKRLRTQLQVLGKEGKEHGRTLGEGFTHAERAMAKTAGTVRNVLTPALGTIGIATLSVTAALAGIQAAVRNFTTNASGLGQLGRDTGIAAQQLRDVQSILGKVGVDAGSSGSAIQNLAEKFRVARTGGGELMEFLRTQGKSAEGRKYFNDLADSIMRSKDNGEALTKALEGMEGIEDPAGRRKYAEQVLGLADAARLAEKHRGTIREQLAKAGKDAGPLTPEMVKSAEDYDKAMGGLATTMKKIGTAIAMELEGPLAKIAVAVKGFMDDGRQGATPAIVQTVRDAVAYIESVDWAGVLKKVGDGFEKAKGDVAEAINQIGALLREFGIKDFSSALTLAFEQWGKTAAGTATAIRSVALALGALNDAKNFDFAAAGSKLAEIDRITATDIGVKKPGRPFKPLSDEQENLVNDTKGSGAPRAAQIGERLNVLGRQLGNFEGMPKGPASEAAEKRAEEMRREMTKLTDELRRLRDAMPDKKPGEATVEKSSLGDEATSGSALAGLIHKSSYGGGTPNPQLVSRMEAYMRNRGYNPGMGEVARRLQGLGSGLRPDGPGQQVRRSLGVETDAGDGREFGDGSTRLYGGPGEGRGRFPEHQRDQMRESFRKYLMRKVPGYDGGPIVPNVVPGGPGDRVGRALRGVPPADTGAGGANPGDYKDVLDHIAKSEGTAHKPGGGYNTSLGYGRYLPGGTERNLTGMTLDEISALGHHMRRQPGNPNSSALGRYQIVGDTMRRLQKRMGLKGTELFDEKLQDRMAAELARDRGANPRGLQQEWASLVGEKNRRAVELMQRVPRGASTAPQDRPAPVARERADGEGFAGRQRAMRTFEQGETGQGAESFSEAYKRRQAAADGQRFDFGGDAGKAMMEKARRSPMLNGGGTNVRGDVSVIVNKPGPDTKVSTSASGNLFRDVKLNRGATMAQASQEN